MQKLKWQFFVFTLFLFCTLGFFASKALKQIHDQEIQTYERIAESVYNQFQARISDFLASEDARTFSEYQFVGKSQELSEEQREKGFLGYFQIYPDGRFKSQFESGTELGTLKLNKIQPFTTSAGRSSPKKAEHDKLEEIVSNLILNEPASTKNATHDVSQSDAGYVQLNDDKKSPPSSTGKMADTTTLPSSTAAQKDGDGKSNYPNPFRKFQSKSKWDDTPKEKTSETENLSEGLTSSNSGKTPPLAQQQSAPVSTFKPDDLGLELAPMTDPFQARLIAGKYLLFYRKAWSKQQIYQQGFALDLKTFCDWLLAQSYDDTILPNFTTGHIRLDTKNLATFGQAVSSMPDVQFLFKRELGYPLTRLSWELLYRHIPTSNAERFLQALTVLVFGILLLAVAFIYKSVTAQMQLALKKEDFVSAVSHELKSPLTSIRLSSELLHQGWIQDPEKIKSHYKMLLKESSRLSRLIENVLSVARLEKKKYRLALQKRNPEADFAEISKELQTLVEQEGFSFVSTCETNLPQLTYDPDALKQIFYNLVENSLKFCKDAPQRIITMTLAKQNSKVVWQIRDHGPGIPEAELKKVFDKFYRVENELTRKTKGSGIGLSLVKTLAEQMGARVVAKNHLEGGLIIQVWF